MKRSDFYIRIITVVLFLAVASYIGVYIYNATLNTFVTTPAISFSVEDTISTYGYVVRSETVLTDAGAAILPTVSDGEKVASGQAIAVEYLSREALEMASELRALRLRVAQLESADEGELETARHRGVMELSTAVQSGNLSHLDELSLRIETLFFAGSSSSGADLPVLQAQLEVLENRIEGIRTIYAPVSGVFSQVVDGYEDVGPGALVDLTPTKINGLFSSPSNVRGVGKLVTEFRWYFVAIIDLENTAYLSPGRRIPVQFSGAYNETLEMRIESIGRREDDMCTVLFSSDRSIHDVAPLRFMRTNIVLDVVTGIRIPKEAIHLDDDARTFVYLQTGARAERVDVEILHEEGDVYLVRDGVETGSPLRVGSTIIVKANKLFDGKIVA